MTFRSNLLCSSGFPSPKVLWVNGVLLMLLLGPALECSAETPRYRVIPIANVPYGNAGQQGGTIERCYRWPTPTNFGSGIRFRFMGPTRIVGTVAHSEDPESPLADRSAVIFDWTGAEPKWVATELPLAPNAVGAVALDGNANGIVVGGCLFPDGAGSIRVVACVWRVAADPSATDTPKLLFDAGSACDPSPWFVQSVLTAVGPMNSDGNCLAAGVVNTVCDGGFPRDFATWIMPLEIGAPFASYGSLDCPSERDGCVLSDVSYAECVGVNGATAENSCVFGARKTTASGVELYCGDRIQWDSIRWNAAGTGGGFPIPAGCGDSAAAHVLFPNGQLGYLRSVEVSSISHEADDSSAEPIAGGTIGVEFGTSAPCSMTDCFPTHAAAYLDPFQQHQALLTFDIHYSIVDPQGESSFDHSWVARVESTTAPDTDWMVVGARSVGPSPGIELCEGMIWSGVKRETWFEWCGRSMFDESLVRQRCVWNCGIPSQSAVPGVAKVLAVHDLLPSGVVIGVGTFQSTDSTLFDCGNQLILLTEIADINGDLSVGGPDLAAVLAAWGSANVDCDLNDDGVVNGADLTGVLSAWTGRALGKPVLITGLCTEHWEITDPLSFPAAAQVLGFQDMTHFGELAASLPAPDAVLLCGVVTDVARAISGD